MKKSKIVSNVGPKIVCLEDKLPELLRRKRFTKKELAAMQGSGEWEDSKEARDIVERCLAFSAKLAHGQGNFCDLMADYFPQDYGKALHPKGAWVQVLHPPIGTEYTVPPFSIWFAQPWQMDCGSVGNVRCKRAKIKTPSGDLGIFPREFSVVDDMSKWLGREKEGVFINTLGGEPVIDQEKLHYIMSRGIPRQVATILLINEVKDPTFLWIEIAPQYGEHFGKRWPSPVHCPFARLRSQFIADNEIAA